MKYILLTPFFVFVTVFSYSQMPLAFKYQAIARDQGALLSNHNLEINILILNDLDLEAYSETHEVITNDYGQFSLNVGNGDNATGTLNELNWANEQYHLQVKINENPIGEPSTIFPVPIALYAESSKDGSKWKVVDTTTNINYNSGKVGIGIENPVNTLHVHGLTRLSHPFSSTLLRLQSTSVDLDAQIASYDEKNNRMWVLNMGDRSRDNQFGLYNEEAKEYLMAINSSGNVGFGTANPSSALHIRTKENGKGLLISTNGNSKAVKLHLAKNSSGLEYGFLDLGGGTKIRGNGVTSEFKGKISTDILQINGGSDIAEPFETAVDLDLGSLVIIDEDNPGQLKISYSSYDRRVAGIISGAGGINPGLTLHQEGKMEGNQQIAIAGRVYVKASTQNGSIKPGDLLTSSGLPGHVMKVTKRKRAYGAVIGKALSSLDKGEGLVLVLVNLQ